METKTEVIKNMAGGDGELTITHILGDAQMHGNCHLYAQVTIEPGSSLGYHEHHGESETYYILSGEGEYDDNGTKRTVKAGDVTFTPDGCGHALRPLGNQPIVFMALIIAD
ncbi:MAG: cupin domain-containing protein [Lachnospiraceae bacterium]|nr:cupin domain-containing protein [Lachnospiraceae bacterium]